MNSERKSIGRSRKEVSFPAAARKNELPADYAALLGEIKDRIRSERLQVVLAANAAAILLYWDIGRMILERQDKEGWGTKVIDRLSHDLREAFPAMRGFSPRNLKYMRTFAAAWPDRQIVQEALAQITWYHNIRIVKLNPSRKSTEASPHWSSSKAGEKTMCPSSTAFRRSGCESTIE